MKLTYYKGKHPNFGDDLNPWLWPKILPDFFNEDAGAVFLGIGSIIGEREYPATIRKIVFGAGFVPQYHSKPDMSGEDWKVYFVRGPRTAKMLGLPPERALGDSAILLRAILQPKTGASGVVSFMPHWESLERGNWEKACALAGIQLIDPRLPVEQVLNRLMQSRLVVCEAMHGAIVADALRIPWVPVLPLNAVHRDKWLDWADSLGMKLRRHRLLPSGLDEARLSVLRKPINASPSCAGTIKNGLVHMAAFRLTRLSRVEPCLSEEKAMTRVTEKMLDNVEKIRRDYR